MKLTSRIWIFIALNTISMTAFGQTNSTANTFAKVDSVDGFRKKLDESIAKGLASDYLGSNDPNIAINAAWKAAIDEKLSMQWFVGFIEGRLRIRVPKDWKSVIEKGKIEIQDKLTVSLPSDLVLSWRKSKPENEIGVRTDKSVRYSKSDVGYTVSLEDGKNIEVKFQTIEKAEKLIGGKVSEIDVFTNGELTIIGFRSTFNFPYLIGAFDGEEKRLIWSQKVFCEDTVVRGGGACHSTNARFSDSDFFLFGYGIGGAYLEVFDMKNGKPKCRFSTSYYYMKPKSK